MGWGRDNSGSRPQPRCCMAAERVRASGISAACITAPAGAAMAMLRMSRRSLLLRTERRARRLSNQSRPAIQLPMMRARSGLGIGFSIARPGEDAHLPVSPGTAMSCPPANSASAFLGLLFPQILKLSARSPERPVEPHCRGTGMCSMSNGIMAHHGFESSRA